MARLQVDTADLEDVLDALEATPERERVRPAYAALLFALYDLVGGELYATIVETYEF